MIVSLLAGTGVSAWQAVEANQQRAEADIQSTRAQTNYETARATLAQMVTQIGNNLLVNAPQAGKFRRQLLTEVLQSYAELIRLNPTDSIVLADRAQAFEFLGESESALRDLRRALELDPGNHELHQDLGRLYAFAVDGSTQNRDQAVKHLRAAIELAPNEPDYYNELGNLLGAIFRDYPTAIEVYRNALKADPTNAKAYAGLARVSLTQGDIPAALESIHRAMHLGPEEADTHFVYGEILFRQKNYAEAVDHFTKSMNIKSLQARTRAEEPTWGVLFRRRGGAYMALGDHDKAIVDLNVALETDPTAFAWGSGLQGLITDLPEDVRTQILQMCDRALQMTSNGDAAMFLGDLHANLGQNEEAVAAYTKLIEFEPNSASAYNRRGVAYRNMKEFEKALADFTKAIEFNPKNANGYNRVAWALATAPADVPPKFVHRAVKFAQRAVELEPSTATFWNTLGVAQYYAGDWQAAIAALSKSLELGDPQKAYDTFFLAMAHQQLGNKDEARTWYDRAVRWMDENMPDQPDNYQQELRRFRAEAEELMDISTPKPKPEKTNNNNSATGEPAVSTPGS